jgi:outer membrane protein
MIGKLIAAAIFTLLAASGVHGQGTISTPLTLKMAIATAIKKSPAALSAQDASRASSARLSEARSVGGFNLSVRSGYGYVSKETTFGGVPILERNTLTNSLVLEKLVYSGGRVRTSIDQANRSLDAAEQAVDAIRDALVLRVAEGYYMAKTARSGIDVTSESVDSLQASYDAAVKLKEAGVVTRADVLRADAELSSAQQKLLAAKNDYRTALAALRTTMGLDQTAEIDLTADEPDVNGLDAEKIQARERSDVASAKSALAAANAAVTVAKSGNRPQVFVEADALSIATGAQFPRRSNTVALGVSARVPIWDSGATKASVTEAGAMRDKAQQDLRAVTQSAQLELVSAKLDLENALERQKLSGTQVEAAQESFRVLQAGYREGIAPMTDVLAAQTAASGARFNRLATNYEVQMAQARLLAALGRTDLIQ